MSKPSVRRDPLKGGKKRGQRSRPKPICRSLLETLLFLFSCFVGCVSSVPLSDRADEYISYRYIVFWDMNAAQNGEMGSISRKNPPPAPANKPTSPYPGSATVRRCFEIIQYVGNQTNLTGPETQEHKNTRMRDTTQNGTRHDTNTAAR